MTWLANEPSWLSEVREGRKVRVKPVTELQGIDRTLAERSVSIEFAEQLADREFKVSAVVSDHGGTTLLYLFGVEGYWDPRLLELVV